MLQSVTFFPVLGLAFYSWLGIIALVLLICAAASMSLKKGIKLHKGLAVAGIILGIIHGILWFIAGL